MKILIILEDLSRKNNLTRTTKIIQGLGEIMNLYIIIQTMKVLTNLLIFIALFYSMQATRHLLTKKFKEEIMHIKKQVFMLFTVGLGFLAIAFTIDNIYQFLKIESMYLTSNFFFSISYILFIAAFAYFWYKSKRLHKLPRKELV